MIKRKFYSPTPKLFLIGGSLLTLSMLILLAEQIITIFTTKKIL